MHLDPDDLALLSLGHIQPTDAQTDHLATCPECARELAGYRSVSLAAAGLTAQDQLVAPPPSVWQGIAASATDPGSMADPGDAESSEPPTPPVADLSARRERPRSRWWPVAIAAAVGLIAGVGVTATVTRTSPPSASTTQVVAAATLTPLPDAPSPATGSGTASVTVENGHRVLTLNTNGLRDPGGFYEVWLMDPQDSALVAVGTVGQGQSAATLPIPDAVKLDTFSVVDVSDEPVDGDPAHSSVSVLRGRLST